MSKPRPTENDWNPFGESMKCTGVAQTLNLGFSTKYFDRETGLYYYGERYYNPSTGRFMTQDSAGESGGINLYGYCGNDGANRWDYLGWDAPLPSNNELPAGGPASTGAGDGPVQVMDFIRKHLPTTVGDFTPLNLTLMVVPYPGGTFNVGIEIEGSIKNCTREDGTAGLMGDVEASINGTATLGYGAGGNNGLKRDKSGIWQKNGKPTESPVGDSDLEGGFGKSAKCEKCESSLHGKVEIQIGGKVGVGIGKAGIGARIYGGASYDFSSPITFDAGAELTASGFIGAELYVTASGGGEGTITLNGPL